MSKEVPFPVRLSPQQAEMVDSLIGKTGLNKSVIMRLAVIAFLEQYRDDTAGVLDLMAKEVQAGSAVLRPQESSASGKAASKRALSSGAAKAGRKKPVEPTSAKE